jgi:hypothetical protein
MLESRVAQAARPLLLKISPVIHEPLARRSHASFAEPARIAVMIQADLGKFCNLHQATRTAADCRTGARLL